EPGTTVTPPARKTVVQLVEELIPKSIGETFATNNIAQLVVLTIPIGIALVQIRNRQRARGATAIQPVIDALTAGCELLMKVLLWVVALVPLAVFGVVASNVGKKEGLATLASLAWLILVVVVGLTCQVIYYLVVMAVAARMSPARFLSGARDVIAS